MNILIILMAVLVLSGCHTSRKTTNYEAHVEQLRITSKEKMRDYLSCVDNSSLRYASSKETAKDIALAALNNCETQFVDTRQAFIQLIRTADKHDLTKMDIRLIKESRSRLKKKAYLNAIRNVIEERANN